MARCVYSGFLPYSCFPFLLVSCSLERFFDFRIGRHIRVNHANEGCLIFEISEINHEDMVRDSP